MATKEATFHEGKLVGSVDHIPSEGVPWQIWIVVLLVGIEGVGNLLSIGREPAALGWLVAKVLFVVGLIGGWRWMFVLFLAVAGWHALAFSMLAPFVAFMNLLLVVLVASAFRHFFPGRRFVPRFNRDFDI